MAYWPADYWVTLGTSGLFTALAAVLLLRLAHDLGCSERQGALVGLAYGLATPAYVYATLAYGHQLTAFALFGALYLLWKTDCAREAVWLGAAGLLAAAAAVIELQVAPVVVVLGFYLLVQCLSGRRKPEAIVYFALGAVVPTLFLLGYNLLAFGSPWDMGYFHHATAQFARVHNRQNPLGLRMPDPAAHRTFALGRAPRPTLLCTHSLAVGPWLVCVGLTSADRTVRRLAGMHFGGFRREPELPRMDRGVVDRPSPAGAAPAVYDDSRRGGPGRHGPLVACRIPAGGISGRRRGDLDAALSRDRGPDSAGRPRALACDRMAALDGKYDRAAVVDRRALCPYHDGRAGG